MVFPSPKNVAMYMRKLLSSTLALCVVIPLQAQPTAWPWSEDSKEVVVEGIK